jgi:hypothetical protein
VSRGETAAAVVTVGGLAAVAAWSLLGTGSGGARVQLELDAGSPGCQRHALYRRFDGHAARHAIAQPGGWGWFASPPAAEVL